MKEDSFFKTCKLTLKDLKFLIERYIEFKAGKIIYNDKKYNNKNFSKLQT